MNPLHYFNSSVFFHFVGRQLYNVFLPVVLIQNGYSLHWVLWFLFCSSIITCIGGYVSIYFLNNKNVIYFYIIAILSEICLLGLLFFDQFSLGVFFGIALFEAMYYAFYYISYYAIFTHYSRNVGDELGKLTIVVGIGSLLSPIVGALLLGIGKTVLLLSACVLLFFSFIPLKNIVRRDINGLTFHKVQLSSVWKSFVEICVMHCFEFFIFVVWGIYAYIAQFSLVSVGFIFAFYALANIFASLLVKKHLVNVVLRRWVYFLGVLGIVAVSVYRYYYPSHIIITNLFMGVFFVLVSLTSQTRFITSVKKNQTYYSSMLITVSAFLVRIIFIPLLFFVELRVSILIPAIVGIFALLFACFDKPHK